MSEDGASPKKSGRRRVAMSPDILRRAEQFRKTRETTAALTTFNEVDMSGFWDLKERIASSFAVSYGSKLALTPLAVAAAARALQSRPILNSEVRGDSIIYRDEISISVAVHTSEGLAAPVLHDCCRPVSSLCSDYAGLVAKAQDDALTSKDYVGATFSVTNGGVFGSLFSTPLLGPRQVGILGLHSIQDRAVVVDGNVVVRPMMYVALTYDHRVVEGRDAIGFLADVKALLEAPRTLLEPELVALEN